MINITNRTTEISHHNNSLTIIDIDTDEVMAFVELIEDKDSFFLNVFYSEEGYNTSMLETTLMFVYPKGVVVDSEGDLGIWEKIYHKDNVIKDIIGDNTKIMMEPTNHYEKLINLSVLLNHEEIYKQGKDYYSLKCNN